MSKSKKKIFTRLCPKCNSTITYLNGWRYRSSIKNNTVCRKCRLYGGHIRYRRIRPEFSNHYAFGKHPSKEIREKMRIARLNFIKEHFGGPSFNPNACKFIDKLNQEKGWNLQHALNGGEKWISGYSLDGYDEEKNIVFEYDEKHHYTFGGILKKKDEIKQNTIKEKLQPNKFIRYDEKRNRLYEII